MRMLVGAALVAGLGALIGCVAQGPAGGHETGAVLDPTASAATITVPPPQLTSMPAVTVTALPFLSPSATPTRAPAPTPASAPSQAFLPTATVARPALPTAAALPPTATAVRAEPTVSTAPVVPTCSPPGTAVCDGQGRRIQGPASAGGSATASPTPYDGPRCSPPGTATCDGFGRPIPASGGQAAPGAPTGPSARILDVSTRIVSLQSGGTNGITLNGPTGLAYAVTNSTVGAWCSRPLGVRADHLSIVDVKEGRLIATTATGRGPVWPLVDPSRGVVYVAASDGEVVVHDMETGARVDSIRVGGLPHDLGLDPASGLLFVSNTNDGSQEYIAVVDTASRAVVRQLRVSKLPHRIAVDAEARAAYVMSVESGDITVVDTAAGVVVRVIESGGRGTMAYSKARGLLFVPDRGTGPEKVRVIDAKTGQAVGTVGPFLGQAGHQAFGLAVDDRRGLLFAALGDSDFIGVADITTLETIGVFAATDCVWGVQVDPFTGVGLVTGVTQGSVAIFSLDQVAELVHR